MNGGFFSRLLIVGGTMLLVPATVQAGPVHSASGTVVRAFPDQIAFGYRQALRSLRTVALQQQQRDGGTLSPDSRAMIQARLDGINARYRRALRNNNPVSLDATGRPLAIDPRSDWTHVDLFTTGRQ